MMIWKILKGMELTYLTFKKIAKNYNVKQYVTQGVQRYVVPIHDTHLYTFYRLFSHHRRAMH